jgi:hypothetical protein
MFIKGERAGLISEYGKSKLEFSNLACEFPSGTTGVPHPCGFQGCGFSAPSLQSTFLIDIFPGELLAGVG